MSVSKWPAIRLAVAALPGAAGAAQAQAPTVTCGRITALSQTTASSGEARAGGAIVDGTVGLITGSERPASNRALRTLGGVAAGRAVGGVASARPVFE